RRVGDRRRFLHAGGGALSDLRREAVGLRRRRRGGALRRAAAAAARVPGLGGGDLNEALGGAMTRIAVFLRAVNVGGRRLLMEDFRRALGDAGFGEARTVGAAGTAVVSARSVAGVEAAVEAVLRTETGQPVEVFARDGAQLAAVLAANPFHAMAAEHPNALAVVLLKGEAGTAEVDDLRRRIVG